MINHIKGSVQMRNTISGVARPNSRYPISIISVAYAEGMILKTHHTTVNTVITSVFRPAGLSSPGNGSTHSRTARIKDRMIPTALRFCRKAILHA